MSDAISFEFDQASVRDWRNQIERRSQLLNKSLLSSTQWAATKLLQSLAARTKVSKPLRPIVEDPDKRYLTDKRFGPFGVFRYEDGKKVFKSIYRTGEFGGIRFYDKKTAAFYSKDANGKSKWTKIASGADAANPSIIVPGIMTSKRRNIWRRGFAKKTWSWASTRTRRGGTANLMQVPHITTVWVDRDKNNPGVIVTNNLSYMSSALKGGYGSLNSAMAAAVDKMRFLINRDVARKMGWAK